MGKHAQPPTAYSRVTMAKNDLNIKSTRHPVIRKRLIYLQPHHPKVLSRPRHRIPSRHALRRFHQMRLTQTVPRKPALILGIALPRHNQREALHRLVRQRVVVDLQLRTHHLVHDCARLSVGYLRKVYPAQRPQIAVHEDPEGGEDLARAGLCWLSVAGVGVGVDVVHKEGGGVAGVLGAVDYGEFGDVGELVGLFYYIEGLDLAFDFDVAAKFDCVAEILQSWDLLRMWGLYLL